MKMKGTTCLFTILFILANCSNATSDETTKVTVYYSIYIIYSIVLSIYYLTREV